MKIEFELLNFFSRSGEIPEPTVKVWMVEDIVEQGMGLLYIGNPYPGQNY